MQRINEIEKNKTVITIGNFDGVHRGHLRLVDKVVERASILNAMSVVLTFDMHPYHLLYPEMKPYLLTSNEKREELVKLHGIDYVCAMEFSEDLAQMSAEEFLINILLKKLNAVEVVIGYDARFGHNREGDYQFLKNREEQYGYKTIYVDSLKLGDEVVSSTTIRDSIRIGNLEKATDLLGYFYHYKGVVVHGKKIGHKISFPTLNIEPLTLHQLIPATGIYLTGCVIDGEHFWGVTNVGYSPTIKTEQMLEVEMFVFDFDKNVYDKTLEIEFYSRIREEEKFASIDDLVKQIGLDVEKAKSMIPLYENHIYRRQNG